MMALTSQSGAGCGREEKEKEEAHQYNPPDKDPPHAAARDPLHAVAKDHPYAVAEDPPKRWRYQIPGHQYNPPDGDVLHIVAGDPKKRWRYQSPGHQYSPPNVLHIVAGDPPKKWRYQSPFKYLVHCESVLVLPSLPYCTGMLTSHDQSAPLRSPAHWAIVKIALIKSIRDGVFFDRKYWARHSKTGDILKPVYLSSIIMEDKARQLKNCASKFTHKYTEALMIPSGKVRQGRKCSCGRP